MIEDNKDNNNNNSDNSNDYFESSEERGRKHHKFKDFDNYNNKNSIRAFLSSILKKNPNFSLKHLSPENLLKIYNCYLTNDNIPLEINFNSSNSTQDTSTTHSTKTEENDNDSSDELNLHNDHFTLKKQENKLNFLKDFKKGNQADAREFLFSYFELTNSPFLSTNAFSIMVIDGSKDESEVDKENTEYDDDDDDDEIQDNSNIDSILINKFLKNTGSFEVFVDHYATIVSPCEGKSSNKEFIESRILQFKSVTTILINYPSMISRIPKILKKFAPTLFLLLKQSDLSTSIEAFRCIVAIYNSKSNIIKKKTKRKWLAKLATFCLPDSPLLNLIATFIIDQKLIKFEFPIVSERLIEKSVFNSTKKRNLQKEKKTEDDDYISCSELTPYDDCFEGACSFEILNAIELTFMKIAQIRDKKLKKLKLFMNNDNDDQSNDQNLLTVDEFESEEFSSTDIKRPISFLFNVAIEDTIFGKAALEIIINILIAFSTKSKILPNKNESEDSNYTDPVPPSFVLVWSVFLIRKSIEMFSIAERSGNFKLFERRCNCIQNLCYSIFENKDSIHKYVISSTMKIIRASLLCRKINKTENKHFASISKLAKKLGVNATSNELTLDDVDGYTKNFLGSMKSELIEDEELTQFIHFPFDEGIDGSLMEE